ncbi:MAG TPA: mechanosensitive ion channel family protein [Coriobacteriia bacterium]|nr:mechanosensitive ion channel family protein [Coriobacteriia bacterium]
MSFANNLPDNTGDALIVAGIVILAGFIVDQLVFRAINASAGSRGWAAGRAIAKGLHGAPSVAGLLFGVHLALLRIDMQYEVRRNVVAGIKVMTVLAATAFAARILAGVVRAYTEREGSRLPSSSIFVNLTRGMVWVLGIAVLLGTLGVSITPIITALGVGGLAVGLALQPTLENVFSGIQVLASRQIEPGDLIRLETLEEGTVLDVTWRNTAIRTASNDVVIVPNSVIGRSRVTNFTTLDSEHVLLVPVQISPAADLDLVERIAYEVADSVMADCEGVVPDAEPSVRFAAITPTGLQLNIAIRVLSYPDRIMVRHELLKRLLERFAAEGVMTAAAAAAVPPPTASA